ncbi:hypothetical protein NC99_13070 [Sunxiuqinia dokdonensis]|uniref:Uncharacterized protein n=1 Tax=Sunxiuqinia dokdonensis TaxID=1409788 RepID=A0A0L8VBL2_9BACT|nr:hypothetical protein NC99_13070 [Sunxiuqinia dokdonensis]
MAPLHREKRARANSFRLWKFNTSITIGCSMPPYDWKFCPKKALTRTDGQTDSETSLEYLD